MNIKDTAFQALGSLMLNRMRTFLTVLGLSIGVGAIIAIGSIGYAGIGEVQAELNRFGINRLWLSSEGAPKLTESDVRQLAKSEPEHVFCPMRYASLKASCGSKQASIQLVGTNQDYVAVESLEMQNGRFLLEQDQANALRVVVVEDLLLNKLGLTGDPIGETVSIGNGRFVVVGVIKTAYSSFMNDMPTPKAYMPLSCFEQYIGRGNLDEITVCVNGDVNEAIGSIRNSLMQASGQSVIISSLRAQINSAGRIVRIFSLVLVCVGAICMITGGIGVMNVLLTAVRERKREIGIRKAVGAKDRDIAVQFVAEALIYGCVGAAGGLCIGFLFTRLGSVLIGVQAFVHVPMVLLAIAFSCVIGLVSGVYPALRASKVPPVAAMRSQM